jgi:UDP-glucose 4-epimerase
VFNIGNPEEITIRGLAERVIAMTGSHSKIQYVPYDKAYAPGFEDMRRRVPSLEKITRLTGYTPRHSLDDTLSRVIAYEKDRLNTLDN